LKIAFPKTHIKNAPGCSIFKAGNGEEIFFLGFKMRYTDFQSINKITGKFCFSFEYIALLNNFSDFSF
jgi:hypothetical protein